MTKIELREGHLEILSRISRSSRFLYAIDLVSLNLPAADLTDLFRWKLIKVKDDRLETLGPYQLTNTGRVYLDEILNYASKELSGVV